MVHFFESKFLSKGKPINYFKGLSICQGIKVSLQKVSPDVQWILSAAFGMITCIMDVVLSKNHKHSSKYVFH